MTWVGGNRYLSLSEMQINAWYIKDKMLPLGWTINSVCGMLGNMHIESTINPSIWQNLSVNPNLGFGLVQWTPAIDYINWCNSVGRDYEHMDTNLYRINFELENGLQYYPTTIYPMTFQEFKESLDSPSLLADVFLKNYERPSNQNQPIRGVHANYWYEYLTGDNPPEPPYPIVTSKSMSLIYYLRRR